MENLAKFYNQFLQMLIRKSGIGIGEDTERYLIVKAKASGNLRFYLKKEPAAPIFSSFSSDSMLTLVAVFFPYYGHKNFDEYDHSFYSYSSIPSEHLQRIDRSFPLFRDKIYILPNVTIYSDGEIEELFETDENGIYKHKSARA